MKEGDLFKAEDQLRWAIRFTLEPEKYLNGYGGGYGHGPNDIFQIPKFTLSGSDITIREVLNRITLAQGNALWVATIKTSDLEGDEPPWTRKVVDKREPAVTSAWRFFPLAEIAELAKQHVAVDLMIAGLLDKRIATIPVMPDHGLAEDSIVTDASVLEGSSYLCSVSIEKVAKDFVAVSVHVEVECKGEAEFVFKENLQVYKDRITEVRPEPRIRIRGYFERAEKP